MRRATWWQETRRVRLALTGAAAVVAAFFALVAPTLAPLIGGRGAALLQTPFALACLAGLLLFAGGTVEAINRRHDKGGD